MELPSMKSIPDTPPKSKYRIIKKDDMFFVQAAVRSGLEHNWLIVSVGKHSLELAEEEVRILAAPPPVPDVVGLFDKDGNVVRMAPPTPPEKRLLCEDVTGRNAIVALATIMVVVTVGLFVIAIM